jgi:leucyl-tRNA synthetase
MNDEDPMDNSYNSGKIEPKWQAAWKASGKHAAETRSSKPKFFAMEMFPYPSGAGLHAGHLKNYVPTDAFCRYKAMKGFNVLYPMGWDAFGQPAENEAIKRGRQPADMVREYSGNFRRAMQSLGLSYDWTREINTSDPEYYRWTQWFFLLLYKRGLAYRSMAPINWCPACATGLANEEVKEGRCWRCDTPIEKRNMPQWYFRITNYAERLADDLEGLQWPEGIKAMQRDWIGRTETAEGVQFKLRDWLISRQRYWGAPIPIVHCAKCGEVPVPEDQLPVKLPAVASYKPSGTGESPLATIPEFVNCQCPSCGGDARRETDTMGGFACSSWYFLRYADPHNQERFADRDLLDYWLPVDLYLGGAEHAVMHLLYARFWTKVMYDEGLIGFQEPFRQLRNQGTVLAYTPGRRPRTEELGGTDDEQVIDWIVLKPEERATFPADQIVWRWVKMSKSKGNGVEPHEIIEKYGADSVRLYMMFVAAFEDDVRWSEDGLVGANRFLTRFWRWTTNAIGVYDPDWSKKLNSQKFSDADRKVRRKLHQIVAKVGGDLEAFSFNTAIAALHELVNELHSWLAPDANAQSVNRVVLSEVLDKMVRIISPFVPQTADELWSRLGNEGGLYGTPWPEFDPSVAREDEITLVVQVNGKVRDRITVSADSDDEVLKQHALASQFVQDRLAEGMTVAKVIVVPKRLVNVVFNSVE